MGQQVPEPIIRAALKAQQGSLPKISAEEFAADPQRFLNEVGRREETYEITRQGEASVYLVPDFIHPDSEQIQEFIDS